MRRIAIIFTLIFVQNITFSQSVMDQWKGILNHPGLAEYFSGMYESLGITVEETGEKVTLHHRGDHFDLEKGINPDSVSYNITIQTENVKNMAEHGLDGEIDPNESYKIMRVLFTPFTKSALESPWMNKSFQMKLAGIENHVHVYLHSPDKKDFVAHTLIFINDEWVVIEGVHGDALRRFDLQPKDAIIYQRAAFQAQKVNTRKSWKAFKKFYLDWRKTVSKEINQD